MKPLLSFALSLWLLIGLNWCIAGQTTIGQTSEPLPFPGNLMRKGINEGNYLAALAELQQRETQYLASSQWRGPFLDFISYASSFVGNYQAANLYFTMRQKLNPTQKLASSAIDQYTPLSALSVISQIADSQQVIMINEAHHVPLHRALTTRLLPLLYAKGFRYLALEDASPADAELHQRGYPLRRFGAYTIEPVFGNLIRTALRLGYKIIPYEYEGNCAAKPDDPYFCANERERGQAQNIYDRILKEQPQAKILVHGGAGHIQERIGKNVSTMAAHFKTISKIDPFTIDQMEMSEYLNREYASALYLYVTEKWSLKEPTVFQSRQGGFWNTGEGTLDQVDLKVFHPQTVYEEGRPTWLKMDGSRKPYAVFGESATSKLKSVLSTYPNPFLVQAFVSTEDAGAVPVDQIVVANPKGVSVLMLPAGSFRIRAIDETGKLLGEEVTSIK